MFHRHIIFKIKYSIRYLSLLSNIYVTAVVTFGENKRIIHLDDFQYAFDTVALAEFSRILAIQQRLVAYMYLHIIIQLQFFDYFGERLIVKIINAFLP